MPSSPRKMPLGLLYFLAGMPLGIFADVMPVFLRTQGVSLEGIGWASALNLPYSFKALLAPLVDRTGWLRRWVVALAVSLLVAYCALGLVAGQPVGVRLALSILLMTSASAVFDIALDAAFVVTLHGASSQAQGQANARRLTAFKTAMVLVSSTCVVVAGQVGFQRAFFAVAALHAALMVAAPWHTIACEPARVQNRDWLAGLLRWMRQPAIARGFAVCFLYKLSIGSFLWMEKAFWVDRGVSLRDLGVLAALVGLAGTVAGANVGSRLAHRVGLLRLLDAGLLMQVALGGVYMGLSCLPGTPWAAAAGLAMTGVTFGLSTAALMSLITRLCTPEHAATQFAALTGAYAFARSVGGILAGATADRLGYMALFALVAALVVPAACLIPRGAAASHGRWAA